MTPSSRMTANDEIARLLRELWAIVAEIRKIVGESQSLAAKSQATYSVSTRTS